MGVLKRKKEIGPDTVLQRKPNMLFNEIDGEVVMLSIENSEYYGMDKVGSRIWGLIEKPLSIKELVAILMEEYNVTEKQCLNDTIAFLSRLSNKNMIVTD